MSAPSIRFVLLPCEACGSDSPPGISAKVSVDSFSAHLGGVRNSCPQNAIMSLTISKAIVIIPSDTKQIHLPIFPYRPSYLPHHIDDVATAHNPAERVGASTGQNRQRTPCRGKEVVAKLHWARWGRDPLPYKTQLPAHDPLQMILPRALLPEHPSCIRSLTSEYRVQDLDTRCASCRGSAGGWFG